MSREQTRLPFLGSIGTLIGGMAEITSESSLIALALALGARSVGEWHPDEVAVAKTAGRVSAGIEERVRAEIQAGGDPLGDLFCALRTPVERRESGATYTPKLIVEAMTRWALANVKPGRVVDACGVQKLCTPVIGQKKSLDRAHRTHGASD
jgi:hypothetical protein